MQARKGEVVTANIKGVEFLFRKNKVTWLKGAGRIAGAGQRRRRRHGIRRRRTSSSPPAAKASRCPASRWTRSASSPRPARSSLTQVPKHLVVIGGGYHRAGTRQRLAPARRRGDGGRVPRPHRARHGHRSRQALSARARQAGHQVPPRHQGDRRRRPSDTGVTLTARTGQGRRGRDASRPTSCWSRSAAAPSPTASASKRRRRAGRARPRQRPTRITRPTSPASTRSATSIAGPMLAHKAEDEGVAVAEILAGQAGHVNYGAIPERGLHLARSGLGRRDRGRAEGRRHRLQRRQISRSPPTAAPARWAIPTGFVKILADKTTDRVLGAHIIGPRCRHADRRTGDCDGIRRLGRGRGAHLPRPPHLERGGEGSRVRDRGPRDSHLSHM